ncbi:MAG: glycosyltransferase family 2 protein [Nitrospirae bacterium]|nr:glycosyltransferase family 2 protein [Nitrospirota bacterium]
MKKPDWSYLKQTDPPDFGQAEIVSQKVLDIEVNKRAAKCAKIIANSSDYCTFEKGLISIVILSCKRINSLTRLVDSLSSFLKDTETYRNYEVILADNGSGSELLDYAKNTGFFTEIINFQQNLGLVGALRRVYPRVKGEYILFLEDDFVAEYNNPFMQKCINIFEEYPEIGIIRLKNQRNWGKKFRRIAPLRKTQNGTEFWTWLPSKELIPFKTGKWNVWSAGSVIFRKISYLSTGELPECPNIVDKKGRRQGMLYEEIYSRKYNKNWLAAKIKNCCPFVQPNDEEISPGWNEATL